VGGRYGPQPDRQIDTAYPAGKRVLGAGTGDGQFNSPHGVFVDPSGNVFVVDTNNHRIQKFDTQGVFLAKWGTQGALDGQLNAPRV